MSIGYTLANNRVFGRSILPGNANHFIQFILEQHLLAQC